VDVNALEENAPNAEQKDSKLKPKSRNEKDYVFSMDGIKLRKSLVDDLAFYIALYSSNYSRFTCKYR